MIDVCALPTYQHVLIIILTQLVFLGIEAWLGKTEKVKASSILQLILNIIFKRKP